MEWSTFLCDFSSPLLKNNADDDFEGHALLELGHVFLRGIAVERHPRMAAYLFELSACHGNAYASYQLGSCYVWGIGVKKDLNKATHYLQIAAEHGITQAMKLLDELEEINSMRDETVLQFV